MLEAERGGQGWLYDKDNIALGLSLRTVFQAAKTSRVKVQKLERAGRVAGTGGSGGR